MTLSQLHCWNKTLLNASKYATTNPLTLSRIFYPPNLALDGMPTPSVNMFSFYGLRSTVNGSLFLSPDCRLLFPIFHCVFCFIRPIHRPLRGYLPRRRPVLLARVNNANPTYSLLHHERSQWWRLYLAPGFTGGLFSTHTPIYPYTHIAL